MGFFEPDGFTPDVTKGVFEEEIQMLPHVGVDFAPVFLSYLARDPVKNADFTLFVVQAISYTYGTHTTGLTNLTFQFALVSEDASPRAWAHELGHFLRRAHGDSNVTDELID